MWALGKEGTYLVEVRQVPILISGALWWVISARLLVGQEDVVGRYLAFSNAHSFP